MKSFFLNIRYFLEYCAFVVLAAILRLFSLDVSANICSFICRKIGPHLSATKTASKNLHIVYGDSANLPKMIDGLWDNFGRFIGEFVHLHSLTQKELEDRVEIVGFENIATLREEGKPFLLCTAHLANWEFARCIAPLLDPKMAIIYRKANNHFVDKLIKKWRRLDGISFIEKGVGGARSIVSTVKARKSIAMLVDQKMNDGISVPFFGMPAMTAPAIAKFAITFDYPIIPMQIIRKGNTSYFQVKLYPAIDFAKQASDEKTVEFIMRKINLILEEWIRSNPTQWFWFHNRWGKR